MPRRHIPGSVSASFSFPPNTDTVTEYLESKICPFYKIFISKDFKFKYVLIPQIKTKLLVVDPCCLLLVMFNSISNASLILVSISLLALRRHKFTSNAFLSFLKQRFSCRFKKNHQTLLITPMKIDFFCFHIKFLCLSACTCTACLVNYLECFRCLKFSHQSLDHKNFYMTFFTITLRTLFTTSEPEVLITSKYYELN